jgi:hypothetical protein
MSRDDQISMGLGVAIAGALAFIALSTCGCGGAAQQHSALNVLAQTADPSYELSVTACDEAEATVIARDGTTYEEDRESIAAIRSVCDRIFGAFETVRLAHRAARAAVDGGASALLDEAMRSLADAWAAAQRLLPEIAGLRP